MKYLFDTDWIVDALRGKTAAIDLIARLRPHGVAVSVVVALVSGFVFARWPGTEVWRGIVLRAVLPQVAALSIDEAVAVGTANPVGTVRCPIVLPQAHRTQLVRARPVR